MQDLKSSKLIKSVYCDVYLFPINWKFFFHTKKFIKFELCNGEYFCLTLQIESSKFSRFMMVSFAGMFL